MGVKGKYPICVTCGKAMPLLVFTFLGNGTMVSVSFCIDDREMFFSVLSPEDIVATMMDMKSEGFNTPKDVAATLQVIAIQVFQHLQSDITNGEVRKFRKGLDDIPWEELE